MHVASVKSVSQAALCAVTPVKLKMCISNPSLVVKSFT